MIRIVWLLTMGFIWSQFPLTAGQAPARDSGGSQDVTEPSSKKPVQIDWRAKLDATQKELSRNPDSAFLHNQAAVAYDALGDFENFDREIHIAIKLEPENPINCYMAYAVYKRRGLGKQQLSVLERALKIDPGNPFGHYEKAGILEDQKNWVGALAEYETTKRLLETLKSDSDRIKSNTWTYVDPRGNPYDVKWEVSHIDDDLVRIRAEASSGK
jgi:hypothetical protein